jgi:hypothetical protein
MRQLSEGEGFTAEAYRQTRLAASHAPGGNESLPRLGWRLRGKPHQLSRTERPGADAAGEAAI